jgi:hypothetical protein
MLVLHRDTCVNVLRQDELKEDGGQATDRSSTLNHFICCWLTSRARNGTNICTQKSKREQRSEHIHSFTS